MIPERKNPLFTEKGIQAAIQGNLSAIEAGHRLAAIYRIPYRLFKKYPKYTGFMALYVHYLYVLGKIEKRQYPPRMTPQLRKEVMRFERCREQFAFLRDSGITTQEDMTPEQYKKFAKLAKKQKILFSAIRDKDDHGALIDVILPVTELDRANTIFERLAYTPPAQAE